MTLNALDKKFKCTNLVLSHIMLYCDLCSCDLHMLDLQWRSPLCTLRFVEITHVHYFYVPGFIMTSWEMTFLGTSIVMSQ